MSDALTTCAVVVIGRNEGERLVGCLRSLASTGLDVVYVDSGSSDGSPERAAEFGAEVVELDPKRPFTAARARNTGIRALRARQVPPRLVQVVDGDCEVAPTWIRRATDFLAEHPRAGIVCGRRRERAPDASVFNLLCDMEWDTPIGETDACGGDALLRLDAFEEADGYDALMIAGEDPEFCHRVRRAGWEIHRIAEEMTLHDAEITAFGQWWLRTTRAGHAYAECFVKHLGDGTGFRRRELRSILLWGLGVPLFVLAASLLLGPWGALPLLGYGVLWLRVRRYRSRFGDAPRDASLYATFCVLGKFAEAFGALKYFARRARGRSGTLIEYKREARAS